MDGLNDFDSATAPQARQCFGYSLFKAGSTRRSIGMAERFRVARTKRKRLHWGCVVCLNPSAKANAWIWATTGIAHWRFLVHQASDGARLDGGAFRGLVCNIEAWFADLAIVARDGRGEVMIPSSAAVVWA